MQMADWWTAPDQGHALHSLRLRIVNLHCDWSNALSRWLRWQTFGVSWLHCGVSEAAARRHGRIKAGHLGNSRWLWNNFSARAEGYIKVHPWLKLECLSDRWLSTTKCTQTTQYGNNYWAKIRRKLAAKYINKTPKCTKVCLDSSHVQ